MKDLALAVLIDSVRYLATAFFVKVAWGWFILTSFPEAPKISMAQAFGFAMFMTILRGPKNIDSKKLDEKTHYEIFMGGLYGVTIYVMAFVIAWIVHFFI